MLGVDNSPFYHPGRHAGCIIPSFYHPGRHAGCIIPPYTHPGRHAGCIIPGKVYQGGVVDIPSLHTYQSVPGGIYASLHASQGVYSGVQCSLHVHSSPAMTVSPVRPTVTASPLRKEASFPSRINPSRPGNPPLKANNPATESHSAQGAQECPNPSRSVLKPPSRLEEAHNGENNLPSSPLYMSLSGQKVIKSG